MSFGHQVIIIDKSLAGGECAISIDGVKLEHVVSYSVQREAPVFATVTFTVHAGRSWSSTKGRNPQLKNRWENDEIFSGKARCAPTMRIACVRLFRDSPYYPITPCAKKTLSIPMLRVAFFRVAPERTMPVAARATGHDSGREREART